MGGILLQEALDEVWRVFCFLLCFVVVVVVRVMCVLGRSSVVVRSGGGVEGRQGRWRWRAAATTERGSRDVDGRHACFLW